MGIFNILRDGLLCKTNKERKKENEEDEKKEEQEAYGEIKHMDRVGKKDLSSDSFMYTIKI